VRDPRDFLRFAAVRACRESAFRLAARVSSRFKARSEARERFGLEVRRLDELDRRDDFAERPFGGSFTPARLAFESAMAIACFVERAPCLPSRMWWISSRTNSPAWVEGDLPSRLAFRARLRVFFSGMVTSFAVSLVFEGISQ
jgi:hypothetical protein